MPTASSIKDSKSPGNIPASPSSDLSLVIESRSEMTNLTVDLQAAARGTSGNTTVATTSSNPTEVATYCRMMEVESIYIYIDLLDPRCEA